MVVILSKVYSDELSAVAKKWEYYMPPRNRTPPGAGFIPDEALPNWMRHQRVEIYLPATINPFPPPGSIVASALLISTRTEGGTPTSTSLRSVVASLPLPSRTENSLSSTTPKPTNSIPHSPGIERYHLYTGNGSIAAGWPRKADWVSYEDMYLATSCLPRSFFTDVSPHRFSINIPLIIKSCTIWHVTPNTLDETMAIWKATLIISHATNTDARFILAIILQESGGCVRVPTSFYSLRNPGLMQSHNGPATCNEDASPIYPCPYETIEEMIREGTAGTFEGEGIGLVLALRYATVGGNVDDVGRYYRAARIYNSGSIDPSGDLGMGVATHCYASDIANRLRGWSLADDECVEGVTSSAHGWSQIAQVKVGLMGVGLILGQ
ncbi:MAG: hypothetical protein Q9166_005855 [cf. Caloplaca sp. 2 TL-2023]